MEATTTVVVLCSADDTETVVVQIRKWLAQHSDVDLVAQGESEKQANGVVLLVCDGEEPPLWLTAKLKKYQLVIDFIQIGDEDEEGDEE